MLKKTNVTKKIETSTRTAAERMKAHPHLGKLRRNWVKIAAVMIVLYMCGFIYTQTVQYFRSTAEDEAVLRQIEEEKAEQKRLLEECEKLKQPAYIEQVAREELGFVKEGEIPYISREKKTH